MHQYFAPKAKKSRSASEPRVDLTERYRGSGHTRLTVSFSRRVPGEAGGSGAPPRQPLRLSGTHPCWMLASNKASRHILSSVRLSPVHVHVSRWHSRTRFDVPRSFDPHTAPAAFSRMWDSYVPYRPERPCLPDRVLGGPRRLGLSLTTHP